jgi:crotonobetainyl-CoA:carnitine CoA-transferase CaiB-like acyl-CoA transferase
LEESSLNLQANVSFFAKFNFVTDYLQAASFPFGPVNTMEEVFQDPQVRHNQLHQEVEHASLRTVKQVRPQAEYRMPRDYHAT